MCSFCSSAVQVDRLLKGNHKGMTWKLDSIESIDNSLILSCIFDVANCSFFGKIASIMC
jgi:hypothetical protein